jgi:hypothetical protein
VLIYSEKSFFRSKIQQNQNPEFPPLPERRFFQRFSHSVAQRIRPITVFLQRRTALSQAGKEARKTPPVRQAAGAERENGEVRRG